MIPVTTSSDVDAVVIGAGISGCTPCTSSGSAG